MYRSFYMRKKMFFRHIAYFFAFFSDRMNYLLYNVEKDCLQLLFIRVSKGRNYVQS